MRELTTAANLKSNSEILARFTEIIRFILSLAIANNLIIKKLWWIQDKGMTSYNYQHQLGNISLLLRLLLRTNRKTWSLSTPLPRGEENKSHQLSLLSVKLWLKYFISPVVRPANWPRLEPWTLRVSVHCMEEVTLICSTYFSTLSKFAKINSRNLKILWM